MKLLSETEMSESAVTLKKLEALQALGDGRATKIVVPTELAGVVSDLSIKGEALNITKDIDQSPKEPGRNRFLIHAAMTRRGPMSQRSRRRKEP